MKRLILLLLLLCPLLYRPLFSQTVRNMPEKMPAGLTISSDRPGAGSDAATNLGAGLLQIESGVRYSSDEGEINNRTYVIDDFKIMNSLVRIGLLSNLEFRVAFAYQYLQSTYERREPPIKGFIPLSLGTKVAICEEKGYRPKIAASIALTLPSTGRKEFQVEYLIPAITFLTETTLSEALSLTGNFGAEWDTEKLQSIGTYALSADAALTSRWGAFVEFYGSIPEKDKTEHLFDAGFVYLVKNNLQVDLSSGISFTESAPDYFVGLGLSWMLISNI